MESIDIKTSGTHCGSCKMLIEMDVNELSGVTAATVDLSSGVTHVEYDPTEVTVERIVTAIKDAGYGAEAV